MAGEVVERAAKGHKKGLRRPKRRLAIRIDMTPMVDIAFLLLIFYMVTTVFSMPQAMEINLPKPEEMVDTLEIKESNLLTIRVDSLSRYWWHIGTAKESNPPKLLPSDPNKPDTVLYRLNSDSLRTLLISLNRENPKLNTLVLINRKARYEDMVNILDEIDYLERGWNAGLAQQLNKKVNELTEADGKFSYRYAIGEWVERDDRIQSFAEQAALASGDLR
ncbi:MAG: biopolymer transporter ExbD [Candidatus Zixiibacteriota bacterium]